MRKKESIFALIPERLNYSQLLISIHKRNKWLIYLRYWTIGLLTLTIISTYFIKDFPLSQTPLWIIDGCIILYNLLFHRLWALLGEVYKKYPRITSLHFSLLQISFDYIALMFFVYYTGGVETPLYSLFILHVIIGSLLLPRMIMTMLIMIILFITAAGAWLELQGSITHHCVSSILGVHLANNPEYIVFHFIVYSVVLLTSNYFANSISIELYLRERSLVDAHKKIEDAEKSKSRYVMSIVHDLKTPISAAITYLNLLIEGTLGKIKTEQLRPVERSKKRLSDAISTINDILQISQLKIESGSEPIAPVNLYKVFDEIYDDMMIMFVSKNIDYSFESDTKEDIFILTNPRLIKLALANLMTNAYKYTEQGGKIQVDISDKKDNVIISVADSGIGIPDNEKESIFHDFYRTTISKRKGIEGSGLGMSVVLHFVNRMKGTIAIESPSRLKMSDERPGTDFIITLPKKFKGKELASDEYDTFNLTGF